MSEEAEILGLALQRVGSTLNGKYHIDGVLGVGGMATVYAATHRNRKRFAVKMLHPEFSVRRDLRARFVREGYVANSVAHPGVVAVLDDDVDELGSPFLVMELLEGVTVDALCAVNSAAIPVREALAITCQLLEVLEAAHGKSVVHRDIKPANLFISRDGELKVLDFGIARLREVGSGPQATLAGAALGTPAFMAPEQARAVPEAIDERTDIWGAGATLFTMLTARFVHRGESARQIMVHAATEPARSIESLLPELPRSVAALVSRALEFEPAQRWQSAAAMRSAALETYRALFGAEPVRADIAELTARTSAAVGTQPTEPGPDSSAANPGARPARELQTTTSTPVATRPDANRAKRGAFWAVLLFASALGVGTVLVRGHSAPSPRLAAPTATRLETAEAPAISALATPTPTFVSTLPIVTASGPALKKRAPARTTARVLTSAVPAATSAPSAAVSPPPDNPLKLNLQ